MNILNKEKILEVAKAFIDEGKLDKAIREYEKILLADPADLKVKLRVAELHTKRKQINEAIRIYREVAEAYTSEGFLLKAVTVFKNILRLNPSLVEVNEELAQLYERMGLMVDAIRQYDILASTLDMKGMGERVVEVRKKIVSLNPEDGAARVRLAELLQREGDINGAIDQYERYAEQVEKQGGDKGRLADLYEKILAHRASNMELVRKLIDIYEEMEEHKKALRWLESAKELVENDVGLLRLAADIYSSQNQHETARMKLIQIAELESANGNVDAALDAYCEILVMLPDEEDRLFKRVEELKPGAMNDLVERSIARRKEIEEEEIRRQVEEDTERGESPPIEPEPETRDSELGKAKARIEAKVEDKEEPKGEIRTAKDEGPKEAPPPPPKPKVDKSQGDRAFDLGTTYRKMGLESEAERELRKALDIYNSYIEGGGDEPSVVERISSIEASLAGTPEPARHREPDVRSGAAAGGEPRESKSGKAKQAKPDAKVKPATGKKARAKPKPKEEKKEPEEPARKKRVSFV